LLIMFTVNRFKTAVTLYKVFTRVTLAQQVSRQTRHFNNLQQFKYNYSSQLSTLQIYASATVYVMHLICLYSLIIMIMIITLTHILCTLIFMTVGRAEMSITLADLSTVLTAFKYWTVLPVVNIESFFCESSVLFTTEYTHTAHTNIAWHGTMICS